MRIRFWLQINTKSYLKLQAFDILGKPLMSGYLGGDFIIFRPKLGEILNFEKNKNIINFYYF
jgi:hypothetical protein